MTDEVRIQDKWFACGVPLVVIQSMVDRSVDFREESG